jgi:hypothetical protein
MMEVDGLDGGGGERRGVWGVLGRSGALWGTVDEGGLGSLVVRLVQRVCCCGVRLRWEVVMGS